MTDLSSLVVRLEAQTSQYTAAIQKATEDIGHFSETVGDSIRDVAKDLLSLEALKQVFDFTDNIVKSIASFENLSQAVGVSTESLSQLSFAGKLSGVDDVGAALEKMARSAGLAETGNAKLQGTFAALGVSLTDSSGRLKSNDQLFLDIADAVSKYNDGIAKTSVVQAIFGRSSAEYIAFLNQGKEAIEAAKQEAVDLNVDISSSAAQAADEFEKNMVRISAAIHGIFNRAVQDALPAMSGLTSQIIAFAKNTDNTNPIVDELATDLKIAADALVVLGAGVAVGSKTLETFFTLAGLVIRALEDLATAALDPVAAYQDFRAASDEFYRVLNQGTIDVENTIVKSWGIIGKTWEDGADTIASAWGIIDTAWNDDKKLDLHLIDQAQIKATESAITALASLDDKLGQQVATYGLSGAAATAYDLTLGKLSASVAEVDKASPKQIQTALAQLEKQGKLSAAAIDDINAAIKAGVPPGEALTSVAIKYATALDRLKAVDSLSKLDSQLLTMTGHLEEAAKSASDLSQRPLAVTIQAQVDQTQFSGLDDSQKKAAVTSQLNALGQQAIAIQDELGKKTADVAAAGLAAGHSNLQIAGDEAAARQNAIAQLEALYIKAQALAETPGLPKEFAKEATEQALALQKAIDAIQFNPKIVDDVNALTQAQKKLNEAVEQQKVSAEDVALAMATLDKQHAQGSLTDLDYMAQQDEARQKQLTDLEALYQAQKKYADEVGDPKAIAAYKQTGVAIENLEAQMGQLAKTVRTDLADDLTNAFVGFATGTETAKKALQTFALDFTKQMVELGAKQLVQKLFETTGINSGIDSLFGAATPAIAATGAAAVGTDTGALASTISPFSGIPALADPSSALNAPSSALNNTTSALNASTSALLSPSTVQAAGSLAGAAASDFGVANAVIPGVVQNAGQGGGIGNIVGSLDDTAGTTAAATSLGTAITTAATAAATEMGAAITTAGSEAAAAMASAIAGASAAGGAASGAGAAFGLGAAAAAGGGQIPANQLTLVGEQGPELFVSDLGETLAATATKAGTAVPDDLTHAHVVGTAGPEYIKPNVSGFVVPSDVFLTALSGRTAPEAPPPAVAGPDVSAGPAAPAGERVGAPQAPSRPLAPVVDLIPLITARLPLPETPRPIPAPAQSQQPAAPTRADGGPVSAGQTIYVGEQGPELLVSDAGGLSAIAATLSGTQVPRDLSSSQLVGLHGPQYVTPTTGGYILPTDVLASQAPQIAEQLPPPLPSAVPNGTVPNLPDASTYSIDISGVRTPIGLTETFTTVTQGAQTYTSINENVNAYVGEVLPKGQVTASGGVTVTANDLFYPPGGQSPAEYLGIYSPDQLAQTQGNVTLASYEAQFGAASVAPAPGYGPETGPGLGTGPFRRPASAGPATPSSDDLNSFASSLPAFASGGSFPGGSPILVGENGPEVIVPQAPGTVIPNSAISHELATGHISASSFPAPALLSSSDRVLGALSGTTAQALAPDVASIAAQTPATPATLDRSTSATILKFENVIRHEQTNSLLSAHEYETLLTDRYLEKRAGGGPVAAGKPYLVGENGPELMVPDSSGTIMSAWADSSQANKTTVVNQTLNFAITTPTGKVDRPSQGQIAALTGMAAQSAVGRNG